MLTSLILGFRHGSEKPEIILGTDVPLDTHHAVIRDFLSAEGVHKEFREVQHWTSHAGLQRKITLHSQEDRKAHIAQQEKDLEAHKKWLAEQSKKEEAAKAPPTAPKPPKAPPTAPKK